jgi:hypothetical protein
MDPKGVGCDHREDQKFRSSRAASGSMKGKGPAQIARSAAALNREKASVGQIAT